MSDPWTWLHDNDFSWDDVNAIAAVLGAGGFQVIGPVQEASAIVTMSAEDVEDAAPGGPDDLARKALATFIGAAPGLTDGLSDDEFAEAVRGKTPSATIARAEGARLERQRIYMALVDRLWTCDSDANAVLDIVENPEDDDLP